MVAEGAGGATEQLVFFYDLGDAEGYLAAERIMAALPIAPEWEPVLAAELGIDVTSQDESMFAGRAAAQRLQPLRWPAVWPPNTELAMLTATYAKRVGRAVAFSLAAYRQAFAGGRDLGEESTVLLAGAACEMHPAAVLKGVRLRSVRQALSDANGRASSLGVDALPAIAVGATVFSGRTAIEATVIALQGNG